MNWFYLVVALCIAFPIGVLVGNKVSDTEGSRNNGSHKFYRSAPFVIAAATSLGFLISTLIITLVPLGGDASQLFSWKTALLLSKEFFFASFIALFIILTVEAVSKREQTEFLMDATDSIKKSVFEAVYKSRLDPKIFKEVENSIFKTPFIRESHERAMVIEPIDDHLEKIRLVVDQKFLVRNVTDFTQQTDQSIHIPISNNVDSKTSHIVSISAECVEGECTIPDEYKILADSTVNSEKMLECKKISDSGTEDIYTFPSIKVGRNALVEIKLKFHLIKDRSDNELLTFLSPTLEGRFSLRSEIDDLELSAISLHRGSLKADIGNSDISKTWSFDRPILPYQGYLVYWSPSSESTDAINASPESPDLPSDIPAADQEMS